MLHFLLYAFGGLLALLIALFLGSLWNKRKWKETKKTCVKTMIVLGSGGHTAEMIYLLETLDLKSLYPRVYVVANTDVGPNGSENKASMFEKRMATNPNSWSIAKYEGGRPRNKQECKSRVH